MDFRHFGMRWLARLRYNRVDGRSELLIGKLWNLSVVEFGLVGNELESPRNGFGGFEALDHQSPPFENQGWGTLKFLKDSSQLGKPNSTCARSEW
jgi:hypothetical protein